LPITLTALVFRETRAQMLAESGTRRKKERKNEKEAKKESASIVSAPSTPTHQRVTSHDDLMFRTSRFNSRSWRCHVTTVGKLLAHICPSGAI